MKIYLLNPPFYKGFIRSSRWARPAFAASQWYPIFLAYAAGWLEKNGHSVKLVDGLAEGMLVEDVKKDADAFNPDIIVVYTSWPSLENDVKIAEAIKNGSLLFLAGPWTGADPEKALKKSPMIDGVIRKELEIPLLALAEGKKISEIKGISWREKENIHHNAGEEFLTEEQLDGLPFVTSIYKKYLNIRKYEQTSLKYPFVDMFSGRGCYWGQCAFCLWPHTIFKGAKLYRKRNIENVIEELKYIKKELPQVKEVFFQDDTLQKERAIEISNHILKNKLKITWSCYAKPLLDYNTLKLMKKAGCRCLHVGYESSNQEILTTSKKGQTPKIMEEFTENARKAKLTIHGDFIIGLPGETEKTIMETIKWAKSLKLLDYQFAVLQPEPGTPMYDILKERQAIAEEDEINYPGLSSCKMFEWRLSAYKKIYLNADYIFRSLKKPKEFKRLLKMARAGIPNLIFKKKK
jgi:anaerobic magnesium-protoporphyrin IX monomethyl ester cyclase